MSDETDMQGNDDRAYAPIADVAAAYGVSVDTIRRRIRKGELQGRKEQTPQGFRWVLPMPEPGETLPGHEQVIPPTVMDFGPVVEVLQGQLQARDAEIARLLDLLESQGRALEAALDRPALPETVEDPESEAAGSPVSDETDDTHISHVEAVDAPSGAWARLVRWMSGS